MLTDEKKFYSCAYARKKGYDCQVKLKAIFSSASQEVRVEKANIEYDHAPKGEQNPLTPEHKAIIDIGLGNHSNSNSGFCIQIQNLDSESRLRIRIQNQNKNLDSESGYLGF
uniref:Uncharacterized protein n=1 Tax=Acrobeloides nanus TaxID=290746 RepID=A0A914DIZ0_9BILA